MQYGLRINDNHIGENDIIDIDAGSGGDHSIENLHILKARQSTTDEGRTSVEILVESETDEGLFVITIGNHKGCLFAKVKKVEW